MGEPALSPGSYLVYFQCDPKVTLVEAACLSDSQGGALLYLLLCWGPQLALLLLSTLVALHRLAAVSFLPASLLSVKAGRAALSLLTSDPFHFFPLPAASTLLLSPGSWVALW